MSDESGLPTACPFRLGATYRTKQDFVALRDRFITGEILTFNRYAHSWYDGMHGFFFTQPDGAMRVWDVPDHEDLAVWRDLFDEVPTSGRG